MSDSVHNTQQIYWMGGSPCAGKTTIAHILAQEYGWQTYHIDRHVEDYLQRANSEQHPTLSAYRRTGLQNFLSMPADWQLEGVKRISQEQFAFIVEDVSELEVDVSILVEGANMLPDDVLNVAADRQHIIWLVPTEDFLLKTYPKRGTWVQDVLRHNFAEDWRLSVFENWMNRDAQMAVWTAQQARESGIRVITVDGSRTSRDIAALVAQHFGMPLNHNDASQT